MFCIDNLIGFKCANCEVYYSERSTPFFLLCAGCQGKFGVECEGRKGGLYYCTKCIKEGVDPGERMPVGMFILHLAMEERIQRNYDDNIKRMNESKAEKSLDEKNAEEEVSQMFTQIIERDIWLI